MILAIKLYLNWLGCFHKILNQDCTQSCKLLNADCTELRLVWFGLVIRFIKIGLYLVFSVSSTSLDIETTCLNTCALWVVHDKRPCILCSLIRMIKFVNVRMLHRQSLWTSPLHFIFLRRFWIKSTWIFVINEFLLPNMWKV
jgi:hypothetical protein